VVDGDFAYSDSRRNRAVLRRGGLMRMSAGSGITHCEYNASKSNALQVLQLWFVPRAKGMSPTLEQLTQPRDSTGRLRLLASPDRQGGSIAMYTDARLYAGSLKDGEDTWHDMGGGRHVWVQVVRGWVRINDVQANAGDGVAISNEQSIRIQGVADGEVLLVDLA
jgi:redox-sensitive bicupin YhaK (pirin superfamily)